MSSRAATPRVLALTGVVVIHAGALVLLISLTRTQLMRTVPDGGPSVLVFLQAGESQRPSPDAAARRPRIGRASAPASGASPEVRPPVIGSSPGTVIDWAAEAAGAAARQVESERERRRQTTALTPVPSPMFAGRPRPPQFHWDHSRTDRLEGFPVFATVVHLSERCTLVVFVIFPMGGCAIGAIPARGDLFEHIHDPELDRGL
jgi:hypothetical protein